jgi:hypothetical protein
MEAVQQMTKAKPFPDTYFECDKNLQHPIFFGLLSSVHVSAWPYDIFSFCF